jgi:5'-nucleotidase
MKMLVTNDDGIYAEGLWALVRELQNIGEVIVVAPDREQSAVGTAVTLHQPLRFSEVRPLVAGIKTYAVEGTPADSVILALQTLLKDEIGVVFSGINEGANLGDDVLISGTVGAALQGYFRGLPSIALSVGTGETIHYEVAAKLGSLLASKIGDGFLSQGMLLNINLPNLPSDKIKGIELTRLARRNYADLIIEGHDGKRKYYWIARGEPQWDGDEGTDIWAIETGWISITPLRNELSTAYEIPVFEDLLSSLFQELK